MQRPVRFFNPHRLARLTAWALAMLTWIAGVVFGADALNERHLIRRARYLSLDRLTRLTCKLAIARAVEIAGVRPRLRVARDTAPHGFRRRTAARALVRACLGARLRKAMKRGDLGQRIHFLAAALSGLDAFARRYLVPRALRRLTKICAIVLVAPPAAAILGAPASWPAAADSS